MAQNDDTIFAPATAGGRAGVSVIRISGSGAATACQQFAGKILAARRATLCLLRDPFDGEAIDEALLLWFSAPHSFTGEDILEIQAHGSRAVTIRLLDVLARFNGFRLAEPGEFARRAFENGKMDLTAIEGLADLVNAETEAQRRQALNQTQGGLGRLYEDWRGQLLEASALLAAALDFSDEEDVDADFSERVRLIIISLVAGIDQHLHDAHRGERVRDGYQVVIAGAPNAGKSTLLNALARREAAIVSEVAGTTRDVIEVRLDIAGYPVLVMDTAGIREASGAVEREGIRRTIERIEDADLVLWLRAADDDGKDDSFLTTMTSRDKSPKIWRIHSKADLVQNPPGDESELAISVPDNQGLSQLLDKLAEQLQDSAPVEDAPLLTRARHRIELKRAHEALLDYLAGDDLETELRAEDLRQAANALGRLTGRIDVEDLLDHIFNEFCIGK